MVRYRTNTSMSTHDIHREIREQFRLWEEYTRREASETIGKVDMPPPADVAGSIATVRFELRGTLVNVTCDSQYDYRNNLRCCAFAIESMRMNEKRGIADTIHKAYLQLDMPDTRDPYEILEIRPEASAEMIEGAYRTLSKIKHPDVPGGNRAAFEELQRAYERIKDERSVASSA